MDTYLTVKQLSEKTGYKESYIRKMCEKKLIPFSKPFGRKILFSEQDMQDLLDRTRRKALYETTNSKRHEKDS